MKRERGFTIIELLVVIGIIVLLAAILVPAVMYARWRATRTECMNNMRQIYLGIGVYRVDHATTFAKNPMPIRLTFLHRDNYIQGDEKIYICPVDETNGAEGGKPDIAGVEQFSDLDEHPSKVAGTLPLSYFYEFSGAECTGTARTYFLSNISWPLTLGGDPAKLAYADTDGDGLVSWSEFKHCQLRLGDTFWNQGKAEPEWTGYPESRFPLLRCFWHADHPDTYDPKAVLNLAVSGNVFWSSAKWEDTAK